MHRTFVVLPLLIAACAGSPPAPAPEPARPCKGIALSYGLGWLQSLPPGASAAGFRAVLSCAPDMSESGGAAGCGPGVFAPSLGVFVYPERGLIDVGPGFPGDVDLELIGKDIGALIDGGLGRPPRIVSLTHTAGYLFPKPWGTLALIVDGETVVRAQLHAKPVREVELCE